MEFVAGPSGRPPEDPGSQPTADSSHPTLDEDPLGPAPNGQSPQRTEMTLGSSNIYTNSPPRSLGQSKMDSIDLTADTDEVDPVPEARPSSNPMTVDDDIEITGAKMSPKVTTNGMSQPADTIANGSTSASAIDISRFPSPPPVPDNKRPICIGAISSRAIMLYPSPAAIIGTPPPPRAKEKFNLIEYLGAEFLRVKLKLRWPGQQPRPDEAWSPVPTETLQVMTPGMSCYIGDLDPRLAVHLLPHVDRGILRLEGFIMRLHPEMPQYEAHINVLLFTLPSNVKFIRDTLMARNIILLDPLPRYDPSRHTDQPAYHNAHGSGENAASLFALAQQRALEPQLTFGQIDKAKQVEVQRQQVDEVFKTLASGGSMEESDPGPLLKTPLYPHQRKALTFLLQREQDWSALRSGRKYFSKLEAKKSNGAAAINGDMEESKGKAKEQARSLWEKKEENGKTIVWRNQVTGLTVRTKKGERPKEAKGAILADDMGLGKTLSVLSLIAATRRAAKKYYDKPLEELQVEENLAGPSFKASDMTTRVFGMPKEEPPQKKSAPVSARRARIRCRSKATLLVCPMSVISNWEDQIKEHWNGTVEVSGGSGSAPPKFFGKKWRPPDELSDDDDFDTLKVYLYYGPGRTNVPEYLADFDVVITSYPVLATEYTRQRGGTSSGSVPSTPGEKAEDDPSPGDETPQEGIAEEIKASDVAAALLQKKRKGRTIRCEPSALQCVDWFRIVLDEAHSIRSEKTVASQASCDLESDRRICLTGTPIQNRIEDVQTLFKFLRLGPVDEKEAFNKYIATPCRNGEQIGVARLQLVMNCCTLRRTKDSTEDGQRILTLPERKEYQMWLDLNEDERKAYDANASKAREKLEKLKSKNELSKNMGHVLNEVLRLRQICDHVDLAKAGAVEEDYDGTIMDYEMACRGIEQLGLNQPRAVSVVCSLKEGGGACCKGCGWDYTEFYPDLTVVGTEVEENQRKKMPYPLWLTKCLCVFCPKCFRRDVYSDFSLKMKDYAGRACTCGAMLRLPTDVIDVVQPGLEENSNALDQPVKRTSRKKRVRVKDEKLVLSSKMQFLHTELLGFSRKNPNSPHYNPFEMAPEEVDKDGKPIITKSIVFSQWTTMLDLIEDMLDDANIKYTRFDGTMSRDERSKAIDEFRNKKRVEVMLVSLRAGGLGLNLTAASRAYLVDAYWNPAVEAQAIDRIHRMGQTRNVVAIKLMIKDSIEQRLDKIQQKKMNLANVSLKNMSRQELLAKKAEELSELFS